MDLRLLTSQSRSFQVVCGCAILGDTTQCPRQRQEPPSLSAYKVKIVPMGMKPLPLLSLTASPFASWMSLVSLLPFMPKGIILRSFIPYILYHWNTSAACLTTDLAKCRGSSLGNLAGCGSCVSHWILFRSIGLSLLWWESSLYQSRTGCPSSRSYYWSNRAEEAGQAPWQYPHVGASLLHCQLSCQQ